VAKPPTHDTVDTILSGALSIAQSASGYRFNLDSVILARSCSGQFQTAFDLGCGCGITGLTLLHDQRAEAVVGLDLQPGMTRRAGDNARRNGFADRFAAVCADVRALPHTRAAADLVVCNPPYFDAQHGRSSPHDERRIARQGAGETIADWVRAAAHLARPSALVAFVYPAAGLAALLAATEAARLCADRVRFIHPHAGEAALRIVLQAAHRKKGARPLHIAAPLIVHNADQSFTTEITGMLERSYDLSKTT
jgi:tRNA1Val (adenine37-N6)-methyltransferase